MGAGGEGEGKMTLWEELQQGSVPKEIPYSVEFWNIWGHHVGDLRDLRESDALPLFWSLFRCDADVSTFRRLIREYKNKRTLTPEMRGWIEHGERWLALTRLAGK